MLFAGLPGFPDGVSRRRNSDRRRDDVQGRRNTWEEEYLHYVLREKLVQAAGQLAKHLSIARPSPPLPPTLTRRAENERGREHERGRERKDKRPREQLLERMYVAAVQRVAGDKEGEQ